MEEFILRNSKELVEVGIDAIHEIKETVMLNPQSDEVESLAEIFKGVSTAMNILKDIQITKMKINTTKEIKEMDIQSKKQQLEEIKPISCSIFNLRKSDEQILEELS